MSFGSEERDVIGLEFKILSTFIVNIFSSSNVNKVSDHTSKMMFKELNSLLPKSTEVRSNWGYKMLNDSMFTRIHIY